MDRIIEVKVGGSHLSKDSKNAGVRGEANVTRLRITFDESWRDYAKTVTFWDAHGNNPVKRIQGTDLIEDIAKDTLTYITPIPAEPLAIAGEMTFVIDGYLDGKRQRSFSDKLIVKDAPIADNAGEPAEPIPDYYEQLQRQIDKYVDDLQAAVKARDEIKTYRDETVEKTAIATSKAEESLQSANRAEATVGKASYIGENGNWYAWDIEASEFYDTGVKAQAGSTVYYGDNPPEEADVWIDPEGTGGAVTPEDIKKAVNEYFAENPADATLTKQGEAADAKVVGDKLSALQAIVDKLVAKALIKTVTINLIASAWVEEGDNQFSQIVSIADVTSYSKVDLQPTAEQLAIFHEKDIAFVTENVGGVVTIYCIGQKPANDYTIQATITEVESNG